MPSRRGTSVWWTAVSAGASGSVNTERVKRSGSSRSSPLSRGTARRSMRTGTSVTGAPSTGVTGSRRSAAGSRSASAGPSPRAGSSLPVSPVAQEPRMRRNTPKTMIRPMAAPAGDRELTTPLPRRGRCACGPPCSSTVAPLRRGGTGRIETAGKADRRSPGAPGCPRRNPP